MVIKPGVSGKLDILVSNAATGEPLPPFAFRCPLMSLPLAFGTTLESIPARVPYLSIPEEAARAASQLIWPATGLRVGIAWAGSPSHAKDRFRSLPFSFLAPLLRMEGVHFFSLQMGPASRQLAAAPGAVTDLAPVTSDLADTAAQMAHLDLVITADTAIAHLAGALGVPVWVAWRARWQCRSGRCSAMRRTGAGCSTATTAPGIRRCASSASPAWAAGAR